MNVPLIGQQQQQQMPVNIDVVMSQDGLIAVRYIQGMFQCAPGMDLATAKMISARLGRAIDTVEQAQYATTQRNGDGFG